MNFSEILAAKGKEAGFIFSDLQLQQFTKYYEMLVEKNKVMNLTAITEINDVIVKHFVDSIAVIPYLKDMGIEKAYINSYDWRVKVYNSAGFETEDSIGFWHKKANYYAQKGENSVDCELILAQYSEDGKQWKDLSLYK